jgi:hypothetical protein
MNELDCVNEWTAAEITGLNGIACWLNILAGPGISFTVSYAELVGLGRDKSRNLHYRRLCLPG